MCRQTLRLAGHMGERGARMHAWALAPCGSLTEVSQTCLASGAGRQQREGQKAGRGPHGRARPARAAAPALPPLSGTPICAAMGRGRGWRRTHHGQVLVHNKVLQTEDRVRVGMVCAARTTGARRGCSQHRTSRRCITHLSAAARSPDSLQQQRPNPSAGRRPRGGCWEQPRGAPRMVPQRSACPRGAPGTGSCPCAGRRRARRGGPGAGALDAPTAMPAQPSPATLRPDTPAGTPMPKRAGSGCRKLPATLATDTSARPALFARPAPHTCPARRRSAQAYPHLTFPYPAHLTASAAPGACGRIGVSARACAPRTARLRTPAPASPGKAAAMGTARDAASRQRVWSRHQLAA